MKKFLIVLLTIFSILFVVVTLYAFISNTNNLYSLQDLSNLGQYLSGTSGILVSLIVAIAALLAYFEQRKQILLFEHSNHKQSIENAFFQLLKYHEEIVKNLDVTAISPAGPPVNLYQGRNAFKNMYDILKLKFNENLMNSDINNDLTEPPNVEKKKKMLNLINMTYIDFDKTCQPYLGYYFRNLYYIITLIDRDIILTDTEKNFYIKMLRAHLSTYELLLLFYSSLSERGNKNAMPLIERYHLLKHVEIFKDKLLDKENCDHMYLYNPVAFGK